MADVSKLKKWAHCDAATVLIEGRLDAFANQDQNADFRDRRTDRTETTIEGRLAAVEAEITASTTILALPAITDKLRTEHTNKLRKLNDRKDNLTAQLNGGPAEEGADAFLDEFDDETDASVLPRLNQAKTQIATHRLTLTS